MTPREIRRRFWLGRAGGYLAFRTMAAAIGTCPVGLIESQLDAMRRFCELREPDRVGDKIDLGRLGGTGRSREGAGTTPA